jgi:hypothetical protein
MRKIILTLVSSLLLSSCGTYTGEGAATGAAFGSILGSAIGGISGGWRGRDIGTIVGMAGGAVVGAAVGSAADQKEAERRAEWEQYQNNRRPSYDYGDDRIDFDAPGPTGSMGPTSKPVPPVVADRPPLEIRNARIIDANHDGILRRGEECQVIFEIMNRTENTLYDIQPLVYDVSGNKHIQISPNLHVESIAPHSGVRYTASILADRRLKDGEAVIRLAVTLNGREVPSETREFTLQTRKR